MDTSTSPPPRGSRPRKHARLGPESAAPVIPQRDSRLDPGAGPHGYQGFGSRQGPTQRQSRRRRGQRGGRPRTPTSGQHKGKGGGVPERAEPAGTPMPGGVRRLRGGGKPGEPAGTPMPGGARRLRRRRASWEGAKD